MIIRLVIRGYAAGEVRWKESVLVDSNRLDDVVADMAGRHSTAMAAGELDMIEFEFLDDPDQDHRFFRIGTDPSGMVMPIQVDL